MCGHLPLIKPKSINAKLIYHSTVNNVVQCLRFITHFILNPSTVVCPLCYFQFYENLFPQAQEHYTHTLIIGNKRIGINCHNCKTPLVHYFEHVNCRECNSIYLQLATELRAKGLNLLDIREGTKVTRGRFGLRYSVPRN